MSGMSVVSMANKLSMPCWLQSDGEYFGSDDPYYIKLRRQIQM